MNEAPSSPEGESRIDRCVAAWARETPRSIAVRHGSRVLDYAALDATCATLADALRAEGVTQGTRVALRITPSADALVAQLAVFRLGASCVVLDDKDSDGWCSRVAAAAGVSLAITQAAGDAGVIEGLRVLAMDELRGPGRTPDATTIEAGADGADLAFVLCEPAGAGAIRCIGIEHRNLDGVLRGMASVLALDATRVVAATRVAAPDMAWLAPCLALQVGGTVVFDDTDGTDAVAATRALLHTHPAACLPIASEHLVRIFDGTWTGGAGASVLVSGDMPSPVVVARLLDNRVGAWRVYGVREATVCAMLQPVEGDTSPAALGRALEGVRIRIVDASGRAVPPGIPGEICIAGVGVACGYLDDADATAARFPLDAAAGEQGARLFRTGEQGRARPDGSVESRGRSESSLHLHGQRVDLRVIEEMLLAAEGVSQAALVVDEDDGAGRRLVAFIASGDQTPDAAHVSAFLKARLPAHASSFRVVSLRALPLLADGRVDRTALAALARESADAHDGVDHVAGDAMPAADWNDTARSWPLEPDPYLQVLFERNAERTPEAIAVVAGDGSLTYAQLDVRAGRIAARLRALGIGVGDRVVICVGRGLDMVAGVLGVLKSGAAYVPIDPTYPRDRIAHILDDSDAKAALLGAGLETVVDGNAAQATIIALADAGSDAGHDSDLPRGVAPGLVPASAAYAIYTSGSTGKPKGVVVPHASACNLFREACEAPGITADDRMMATVSLAFDPSVVDLLFPLAIGARVILADRDTVMDGPALASMLSAHGATMMQGTPSGWQLLMATPWRPAGRFVAVSGGEALPPALAADMLGRGITLWNVYGPTETTVWSTSTRIVAGADGVPDIHIGKPIANTTVHVRDANGQPCPIGVPGEICIGGAGVALGYLGRPELTAEKFIDDASAPRLHGMALPPRLYRTGDRGRWRQDGVLEHLGRMDFQVKLRGHRIELGEIEAVLESSSGVSRAVATVREDQPGDARLVGYVSGDAVDVAMLQARLQAALPTYMVPQHLVALAALPLLPNGKIDRNGLPAPVADVGAASSRQAPAGATQARVAAVMADLLGVPAVGRDDNFFDLGGHSLLGAQLVSRLARAFAVSLPLRALFDAPTVAGLATVIDALSPADGAPQAVDVPRLADPSTAPLSLMQQRLWVLEAMDPGRTTYNIPSAFRFHGALDAVAFDRAFRTVVERQSVLRTQFEAKGAEGDGAVQRVLASVEHALAPMEDLSGLPPTDRERTFHARAQALLAQPIPLDAAPLYRARLFKLSDHEHILFFQVHHAIWDGVSFELLCAEMAELYAAQEEQRAAALPTLERSYGDFAAWQLAVSEGPQMQAQVAHWMQRLSGGLEPLRVPEDQPRPPIASGRGGNEVWMMEAADAERLRELGRGVDATLFMTLLAAYFAFLHRTTGQRDLVVGLPVRTLPSEQFGPVMGFFANVLPMRLQLDPAWTFLELLRHVREEALACYQHPDVPLERLVRELRLPRDLSRSAVYQALFSLNDSRRHRMQWGSLRVEPVSLLQGSVQNDLSLWVDEGESGLEIDLNYNADILTPQTASSMRGRFMGLIAQFTHDPNLQLDRAVFQGEDEARALSSWNDTTRPLPTETSLPAWLSAQLGANASRTAIRCGGHSTTYPQLDARSDRIAGAIAARGVGAGDLVGVCLDRHADLVATLLGVLKAGAAYVPLDPVYPADRLRFMVEDAAIPLVVSEGELADPLALPRERLLLLDADRDAIEAASAAPRATDAISRDAAAYVIYTSGSTGKPKGVVVPHGAVVNFLDSMRAAPGLDASDRLLAVTTTSFDISVLELFLPLGVGAQVVLASREEALDGAALAALIEREGATVMQATPSTWHLLLDAGWQPPRGFKALCGGEAMSVDLAQRLTALGIELWNMYGPTETTVWSTCARIEPAADGRVPDIHVGRPIANTMVWILDERGQACPVGVSGEICIGGAGVALGYLGRDALTTEKFVADGVSPRDHGTGLPPRLYRTGDRGRWRADGVIEHQGRIDFQVKVRGYRIELGEIEATLEADASVARAVAVVREDQPGDVRLVAYVVPAAGTIDDAQLYERMRSALPAYMIPQHVVPLAALPLLPNGKVDRKSLPAPALRTPRPAREDAMLPASVAYLVRACTEVLGDEVAPDDNFFDAGGHSMLAVKLINRIHKDTGVRLNLLALASSTLEQLASRLPDAPMSAESANATPETRVGQVFGRMKRLFGKAE